MKRHTRRDHSYSTQLSWPDLNDFIMNVSIMLNLKVMIIIGLLFIGLTAIAAAEAADENESKQNEGKMDRSRSVLYIV